MKNKKQKAPSSSLLPKENIAAHPDMDSILTMMEKLLHWAAIIDSSDDAIISKSATGIITSWNRGAQRLYGYTAEEIIGQPVSILIPPSKKDDFPFIMKQLNAGKRVERYETQRLTKDGRLLHVSITVSPIRDAQGNIIGASKIARDITERVENEKRRDEFVSIASHELKTPVTSQKIFGTLLEHMIVQDGNTKYKPYIQKMNAQTNKLVKLIEDLLELSRVQVGRMKMEQKEILIDELVHNIVDDTQMTTEHKLLVRGITNKRILGDKERLGQVITNFLSNAIKYSPDEKEILISILAENGKVVISVQDFGIGIAKHHHEKIFERFFRVSGLDENTYPGMGIGLHLCKEIVTRHGGEVWVKSEREKGSIFYFSLPYLDST